MCGICGSSRVGDGRVLKAMNACMVHRGPDDEGTFVASDGGVGLGARRLSVIDVGGGHQPLSNEDKTVWAVLNGEIYNFPRLREDLLSGGHRFRTLSDTEVLVHLYEEHGVDLVDKLDGMFAFAIWDSRNGLLLVARDRFGEKPLFYSMRGGLLIFASELSALLAGIGGRPELSVPALDSYFVYGYIPGDASIVDGIRQLGPGCRLVWDTESALGATDSYWRPPHHHPNGAAQLGDLVERTAELLEQSVASRMISDVPLGVFLSGGLDSTLIAALAAPLSSGQLKTFTVDYDVGDVGERTAARAAAEAVGADHFELILSSTAVRDTAAEMLATLDQPIADPAFIPLRALSTFARREVTVAIGGEGADELFGGYPRYRWLARSARISPAVPTRVPAMMARNLAALPRLERLARLSDALAPGSTFERHLGWVTVNRASVRQGLYGPRMTGALEWNAKDREPVGVDLQHGDVVAGLMHLDQVHWLPDDVLAKADRASMGASLELRTPYLTRELAEFAASVPPSVTSRDGGKLLLRKVLERTLPTFGLGRAKMAFRTPCAEWLRGPLGPTLREQLADSPLYRDGWFERDTVRGWVDEHQSRRTDQSSRLWPLFVLGCWFGRAHQ